MFTVKIKDKEYKIEFDNSDNTKGKINNENFELDIIKNDKNSFHLIHNLKSYNITILSTDYDEKKITLKINNKINETNISDELDLLLKKMGIKAKSKKTNKELKAPMPGLVVKIPVKKGDIVKQGETLLVLEAMKMENNLKAENDVTVKKINATEGASVEKNEILIEFE